MALLRLFAFFFCFQGIIFLSKSQSPNFINYSIREGLPSAEVYDIYSDREGFLWFATDNGVARFDGKDFQKLNVKDGLSDPVVFGFYEDNNGRTWFRTFTGKLSYYQNGKIHKYLYNNVTSSLAARAIITNISYDSSKNLWLSVGKYFVQIDSLGFMREKEEIEPQTLEYKVIDKKSFLGSHTTLKTVKKIKIFDSQYKINLTDTTQWLQTSFSVSWKDKVYIALNSDIFEYSDCHLEKVFTGPSPIISLSRPTGDEVWIGFSNRGVVKTNLSDFTNVREFPELKIRSISRVLLDREGGYWISTLEKGVYYIPNFDIKSTPYKTSARVRAVAATDNTVLVGDYNGYLLAENPLSGRKKWEKKFDSPITALFANSKSSIWVSNYNNTFIFNERGVLMSKLQEASFIDFAQDNTGEIWGSNSYGLHRFSSSANLIQKKRLDFWHRNVTICDTMLYIGGRNGLYVFDKFINFKKELSEFSDLKISKVIPINNSLLLIATIGNGFVVWNSKENLIVYSSNENLISANIYDAIQVDSVFWLATENGIAVCGEKSLLSTKPIFEFISKQNGLLNNKINQLAVCSDKLIAFSDDGYSSIPISGTKFSSKNPIPYLISVKIDDKDVTTYPFELNKLNYIQINIGFLSYNNQNIQTRFRLSKNSTWTLFKNRTIQLRSLDEGDYFLEIEYSVDGYSWNKDSLNVPFRVLPEWWNTWIFRIFVCLAIMLFGVVFYRIRISQYKEKNTYLAVINEQQKKLLNAEIEATERERTRIAKELHDGISTDLASMKFVAEQLISKSETEEAVTIQHQLQSTLTELKDMVYGLAPTGISKFGLSIGLQNYVAKANARGTVRIKFDFIGDEVNDTHLKITLFRIVQELVSNTSRHARAKNIAIHINVFANYLNIVYTDDGIGFDPMLINPGLGLSNIQSRVDSLNGKLDFESGKTGTSYSIDIPLKNNV